MLRIGSTTVEKVHEMDLNGMTLVQLMPDYSNTDIQNHPEWLTDGTTAAGGHALLSLHTWLVRHRGLTILIDTGAGNDKRRPQQKVLDQLTNPFLERLSAAGVEPGDVDHILHTHIHSDHVGWNTRLANGEWVPTFPNAEVICSDLEWRYGSALTDGDEDAAVVCRREAGLGKPVRTPVSGTFLDSMRPLDGRVPIRRVHFDGSEVLPGIRFVPTPGHSIDHASIEIASDGEAALFSGDVFHHPLEIQVPELVSVFCEFPDAARRSRLGFMERAADSSAVVFTSHFPLSSAGRVGRTSLGFEWRFI